MHDLRARAVPNIELPPLCSPDFRAGPPSDEAQALAARLRNILLACALSAGQHLPQTNCADQYLSLSRICASSRRKPHGASIWTSFASTTTGTFSMPPSWQLQLHSRTASLLLDSFRCSSSRSNTTASPLGRRHQRGGRSARGSAIAEAQTASSLVLVLHLRRVSLHFELVHADKSCSCLFADPSAFEESLSSAVVNVLLDETGQIRNLAQVGLGSKGTASSVDTKRCIALARECCNQRKSLLT
jgi:hypothetical protein